MTRIINTNLLFFSRYSTLLPSDDYNDVRLGGHGTLHGYSNCVNPFLEVNLMILNLRKIFYSLL
jgi:hypothetical protein